MTAQRSPTSPSANGRLGGKAYGLYCGGTLKPA